MKKVFTILLLLVANFSFADQLAVLTSYQVEKTLNFIKDNDIKTLLFYCGCCDNPDPHLITMISKIETRTDVSGTTIVVTGKRENGSIIEEELDLAYVYVNVGGEAKAIGSVLGFECDPCVQPFPWPVVSKSNPQPQTKAKPFSISNHQVSGRLFIAPVRERSDVYSYGGTVKIKIWINRKGIIVRKQVLSASNNEIKEIAETYLVNVKYSENQKAPAEQSCTIIFTFK